MFPSNSILSIISFAFLLTILAASVQPAWPLDNQFLVVDGYQALTKGSYLKARTILSEAVRRDSRNAAARRYLAAALAATGDPAGSIKQVQLAQSIDGLQPSDPILLGNAHFALSDLEAARNDYSDALKNADTFAPGALGMVRIHLSKGELAQANTWCALLRTRRLTNAQVSELRMLTREIEQINNPSIQHLDKG